MIDILTYNDIVKNVCVYGLDESVKASKYPMAVHADDMTKEIVERLGKVNIVPAPDDNLFDLLVSTRRLVVSYPPVNQIAYILPLLRQFNGALEISDDANGNTRLYLRFRV